MQWDLRQQQQAAWEATNHETYGEADSFTDNGIDAADNWKTRLG